MVWRRVLPLNAPKAKELDMSSTQARRETAIETPRAVDMKLEVVVIPVSDVDRAKHFYGGLGWRLDADFAAGDDFRVIQFTPPAPGARSSSARTSPRRHPAPPRDSI